MVLEKLVPTTTRTLRVIFAKRALFMANNHFEPSQIEKIFLPVLHSTHFISWRETRIIYLYCSLIYSKSWLVDFRPNFKLLAFFLSLSFIFLTVIVWGHWLTGYFIVFPFIFYIFLLMILRVYSRFFVHFPHRFTVTKNKSFDGLHINCNKVKTKLLTNGDWFCHYIFQKMQISFYSRSSPGEVNDMFSWSRKFSFSRMTDLKLFTRYRHTFFHLYWINT